MIIEIIFKNKILLFSIEFCTNKYWNNTKTNTIPGGLVNIIINKKNKEKYIFFWNNAKKKYYNWNNAKYIRM